MNAEAYDAGYHEHVQGRARRIMETMGQQSKQALEVLDDDKDLKSLHHRLLAAQLKRQEHIYQVARREQPRLIALSSRNAEDIANRLGYKLIEVN